MKQNNHTKEQESTYNHFSAAQVLCALVLFDPPGKLSHLGKLSVGHCLTNFYVIFACKCPFGKFPLPTDVVSPRNRPCATGVYPPRLAQHVQGPRVREQGGTERVRAVGMRRGHSTRKKWATSRILICAGQPSQVHFIAPIHWQPFGDFRPNTHLKTTPTYKQRGSAKSITFEAGKRWQKNEGFFTDTNATPPSQRSGPGS